MSAAEHPDAKSWSHWTTPEDFLRLVRLVAPIALDPCWNPKATSKARCCIDEADDGLGHSWCELMCELAPPADRGLVFVNPPYSRGHIERWAAKMSFEASRGCEIVALLPANMDAGWMHDHVLGTAWAAIVWRGRIQFQNAPPGKKTGGNRYQSLVAYWGPNVDRFAWAFAECGKLWRLR